MVFTSERNGSADLDMVKSDGTALQRLMTTQPAAHRQSMGTRRPRGSPRRVCPPAGELLPLCKLLVRGRYVEIADLAVME